MLEKIKQNLRSIDGLPIVIDTQSTGLENWCKNKGWTNFEVTNNLQFLAVPPGSSLPVPVPVEAFSELKSQEISALISQINTCKQTSANLAVKALVYNLCCLCILALNKPVKEAMPAAVRFATIAQANFAASMYWLIDISTALSVIYIAISSIESLLKRQEYRKLKDKLSILIRVTQNEETASSSLLTHTGMFFDDPFFDEFVEAMAANRHELDAEVNAWLDAEENRQKDPDNPSN